MPDNAAKKRIIVCGYPKSGNTWLTRLTAELVGCPAVGFWCEPFNEDESIEGLDRASDFLCFKAHHSIEQLEQTLALYGNGTEKIIYVHRDPRDIVVSASHYFIARARYKRLYGLFVSAPSGHQLFYKLFHTRSYLLDLFTRGLIEGTREGAWLNTPWKEHVRGFLAQKDRILVTSYEALKADPQSCAKEICAFLSIERTDGEIETAIRVQSFDAKKRFFINNGLARKADFLRRGESGTWKTALGQQRIALIEKRLGAFMATLGYPISTPQTNPPAYSKSPTTGV